MLQNHLQFDHRNIFLDSEPRWTTPLTDDLDLDIFSSSIEDMAYSAYSVGKPYAPRHSVPTDKHSLPLLPLESRGHSPFRGPTGWRQIFPGSNEHDGVSHPIYQPSDVPLLATSHKVHDSTHLRNSSGSSLELDALSTISPMSPRTPGARSETDVNAHPLSASPWRSAPPSSATYFPAQFPDFKPGTPHIVGGGISPRDIHLDQDENFIHPQESQGQPEAQLHYPSWDAQYPFGGTNTGGDYPAEIGPGTVNPNIYRTSADPATPGDRNESLRDADGESDDEYQSADSTPPKKPQRSSGRIASKPQPRGQKSQSTNPMKPIHDDRIKKSQTQIPTPTSTTLTSSPRPQGSSKTCSQCSRNFPSTSLLSKHVQTTHTRPFTCIFARYGCTHKFGSKNEWARHIRVQHLRLEIWICDIGKCHQSHGEQGKRHEFDRKDLFTQHVRRMHSEVLTSLGYATEDDEGQQSNTNNRANKAMIETQIQQRCHHNIRSPPSDTTCMICSTPTPTTTFNTFEANLEHTGKHLESPSTTSSSSSSEDPTLKQWLLQQDLLHWSTLQNGYRIVGCEGKKTGKAAAGGRGNKAPTRRSGRNVKTQAEGEEDSDAEWDLSE